MPTKKYRTLLEEINTQGEQHLSAGEFFHYTMRKNNVDIAWLASNFFQLEPKRLSHTLDYASNPLEDWMADKISLLFDNNDYNTKEGAEVAKS